MAQAFKQWSLTKNLLTSNLSTFTSSTPITKTFGLLNFRQKNQYFRLKITKFPLFFFNVGYILFELAAPNVRKKGVPKYLFWKIYTKITCNWNPSYVTSRKYFGNKNMFTKNDGIGLNKYFQKITGSLKNLESFWFRTEKIRNVRNDKTFSKIKTSETFGNQCHRFFMTLTYLLMTG